MEALVLEADALARVPGQPTGAPVHLIGSQNYRNPTIQIYDIPFPSCAPDEVIIEVSCCGICGSDLHCLEADSEGYMLFSGPTRAPIVLGHEFCGRIVEIGRDVRSMQIGQLVSAESIEYCGTCFECKRGLYNQCDRIELLGLTRNGAFASFVSVKAISCWSLEPLVQAGFDLEEVVKSGSLLEPVGCAYNALFVTGGGFDPGAFIGIHGAGPIGLGAIALAKIAGASRIVAFDIVNERLELAKYLGADVIVNVAEFNQADLLKYIGTITGGRGLDIQMEAAGAAKLTMPLIQAFSSNQCKVLYLGRGDILGPMDTNVLVSKASSIIGSRGHVGRSIFGNLIRLISSRTLNVSRMITREFDFCDVLEAFTVANRRIDGKVLVRMK